MVAQPHNSKPEPGDPPVQLNDDFLRLLLQHQRRIFGFIVTLLPNWADAEEVYQDTCLVMWTKWREFDPGTNFVAWACKIAQYKVMNFRKNRSRGQVMLDQGLLELIAQERIARESELDLRYSALTQCLEKLSPGDRELVQQCYGSRETTKQFAERIGRPADTLYKALRRIRLALFGCVERTISREGWA